MLMLKLMLMLTRRPPLVCTLHLHIVSTTHCRMVLLARARSLWMFAWGWVYSLFSDLHAREAAAMVPIRSFAALTLAAAAAAAAGANDASAATDSKQQQQQQQQQQRVTAPPSPATEAAKAHSSGTAIAGGSAVAAGGDTATTSETAASDLSGSASAGSTTDSSSSSTKQRSSSSVNPLSALCGMASHTKRASCMMDETITLLFAGQVRYRTLLFSTFRHLGVS
jgi:hypothetical protein